MLFVLHSKSRVLKAFLLPMYTGFSLFCEDAKSLYSLRDNILWSEKDRDKYLGATDYSLDALLLAIENC